MSGGDPDIEVKRRGEGRAFQREDPMVVKDLVWVMLVLTRGRKRTCQSKERSGRCEVAGFGRGKRTPQPWSACCERDGEEVTQQDLKSLRLKKRRTFQT